MSERPFRRHEELDCELDGQLVAIDRGLSTLVRGLWLRGISTQTCCERDYVRLDDSVIESEHAYIGFSSGTDAQVFLAELGRADPELFAAALRQPAAAVPWLGNGYTGLTEPPHPGLAGLGSRWAFGAAPWILTQPRAQVFLVVYVGFPVSVVSGLSAALTGLP